MTEPVTVLVADRDVLFRTAVAAVLAQQPGFRVVAEAGDADEAVRHLLAELPAIALVGAELPPGGGPALCTAARTAGYEGKLVVYSTEPVHVTLLAAMEAGADGYLVQDLDVPQLVETLHAVLRGEAYVPVTMLGGLLHDLVQRRRDRSAGERRLDRLSRREREVLALLAGGRDVASIAAELVISVQTARTHIQNVMTKLEVHSRLEAVAFAREHGILDRITASGD